MFTIAQVFFFVLFLGAAAGAQAGDIYRWVDEQGHTHFSDVVPDKYREAASRTDSRQYELTPEQQRQAAALAERERASSLSEPVATKLPPQATPKPPEPPPVVKRPTQSVTDSTDCATWWRLFRESQECFGPFHTVGGGLKPEAFEYCNEIPSPKLKCGPDRN
jgi:hypothetical protein